MKKKSTSSSKLDKTMVSTEPETTIVANVQLTFIINDEMSKEEAQELIKDVLGDCVDAMGNDPVWDDVKYKGIKVFFREVKK